MPSGSLEPSWGDQADTPEKCQAVIFLLWGTGILVENEEATDCVRGRKRKSWEGSEAGRGQEVGNEGGREAKRLQKGFPSGLGLSVVGNILGVKGSYKFKATLTSFSTP